MSDQDRYRLPKNVIPSRYDIELAPDLETFRYDGVVDVTVLVGEPVAEIVVNAVDIEFGDAWLEPAGGERIPVAEVRVDEETERAHLTLASEAPVGDATLHIAFVGQLNDRMRGFYRSTYTDDSGEHTIATTQCEPTDARSAFPCWDEPEFKAIFGLTLVVPEGLAAFANGPEIASEDLDDGRRRVRFADTMVMSTYLTAWCVGRLEATESIDVDGVPVRIIHVPGREELTAFSLEVAAHSLRFFTEYYGIPYPEQKLDLAAIPDFAAGAMENPGLVTFRETALLVDPARATQTERERIAGTVAHEIAHMWFGDLVTMRWWNGIWLNEAFATFMALLAVDSWKPEWRVFDSFGLDRAESFEVDGLLSTRSIEYEVIAPSDVEDMFDVLTYEKGGSVLWMLEQYLGRERFRDGIRAYLAKHAYGNTETHDLWDALEEVTGEPVRRVADAWIWQGGYPIVNVSARGADVHLGQERFTYLGEDDGRRWPLPLAVRAGGDTRALLLEADGATLEGFAGTGPVVANAGGWSFARVRYDDDLRARLTAVIPELSPLERFMLVDDTWAAVEQGSVEASEYCDLVSGFGAERDDSVWKSIAAGLSWCDRFLSGPPRKRLHAFVRELGRGALGEVGWDPADGESDLRRELRGTLVRMLGVLGHDDQVRDRSADIERAARSGEPVDGPLAAATLAAAATVGGDFEWDAFVEMYRVGDTPQTKRRYLQALALIPGPDLMQRTLSKALDGYVRSQDLPLLIGPCLASREHGRAAWQFVKEHWDELIANLTPHLRLYMVEAVRVFSTQEERDDVLAFFAEHPLDRSEKMLEHVLERQQVAVALRAREAQRLAGYFSG